MYMFNYSQVTSPSRASRNAPHVHVNQPPPFFSSYSDCPVQRPIPLSRQQLEYHALQLPGSESSQAISTNNTKLSLKLCPPSPRTVAAERFPENVQICLMEALSLDDLWKLISVSPIFQSTYKAHAARITGCVGRRSFRYDPDFGKYFPIEYHGSWLEERNKDNLPFPGWQRHLRHLQLLLLIEDDLFEVSKWIHWSTVCGARVHGDDKGDRNKSSCPLYIHANYECGITYSVLVDFAQKSLYGPNHSTRQLPNPWDTVRLYHRHQAPNAKQPQSLYLATQQCSKMKYDPEFRVAIINVEILLVQKLWHGHSRPISKPCCWNNNLGSLTIAQRPRKFVQIAPFRLMLNLFHSRGDLKCISCDRRNGVEWNDAYAFFWELATYWAATSLSSPKKLYTEDWVTAHNS
ncbi:hypothetical protein H072_7604 [Dactylellina haptotyla CBS 200.50]|uniref:F-box domain-containing protein n=1 Tax=Dactylellina haptotyla (strain CBS 200.50) TaxID=1284197 RepID=S8BTL8_DACHA|nr:hypothetical protein H072_7604 [Dactylellina haptotyla CBS 200.50]